MIAPLLSVGGTALGTFAWQALRQLQPGEFVRELLGSHTSPAAGADAPVAAQSKSSILEPAGSLKSLVDLLRERLTAAGVDLAQPVVLKEDGSGTVVVDGDHPDRAAIEQVLSRDARLRMDFLAVAAGSMKQRNELAPWLDTSFGEFRLRLDDRSESVFFD